MRYHRIKGAIQRKIFMCLIILLCLLLGGVARYFYAMNAFLQSRGNGKQDFERFHSSSIFLSPLSEAKLVQKILDALRDPSQIRMVFQSIPLYQLNGITYEEFAQYIYLLDHLTTQKLDTFSIMTVSVRNALIEQLSKDLPREAAVIRNSNYYWLENAARDTDVHIPIMIQKNIQGDAYLSRMWMTRCVQLYDYVQFYLNILKNSDTNLLSKLIYSQSQQTAIREHKADLLMRHYQAKHVDVERDVQILNLQMNSAVIEARWTEYDEAGKSDEHRKQFKITYDGVSFEVLDYIPQTFNLSQFDFRKPSMTTSTLRVGEYVHEALIEKIYGKPMGMYVHDLPDWLNYDGRAQLIDLFYPEISIQIVGVLGPSGGWEGTLRSVYIYRPTIALDLGVSPGMTLESVLQKLPFEDVTHFNFAVDHVTADFGFKEGRLYGIRVTDHRFDHTASLGKADAPES